MLTYRAGSLFCATSSFIYYPGETLAASILEWTRSAGINTLHRQHFDASAGCTIAQDAWWQEKQKGTEGRRNLKAAAEPEARQ